MGTKNKISEEVRLEYMAKQNIFIEAIAKVKWPRLLKDIAMVIYRKTLMFNKMSDCISRKQIADALGWERDLSEPKSENKNERNITKAIRQLEALQIISIKKQVMPTRGGYLDEYTLLDPTGWVKYKHKRGVNANASKSPPKRRKYAPERGVNTHTEEAFAQTPNKLNTNKNKLRK